MERSHKLIRDVDRVTQKQVALFGACAAAVFLIVGEGARSLGLETFNLESALGFALTGQIGTESWLKGALALLLYGALSAFGYSFIFRSARRSGAVIGINLAFFHWMISGFVLGLATADAVEPLASGFFMVRQGFGASVAFFSCHLLFGAAFGVLFDRAAQRPIRPQLMVTDLSKQQDFRASHGF